MSGKRLLGVSSSVGAMAVAMSPAALQAQTATDDETVTTEIVAIDGQQLDSGEVLGGFLPVVIGGEGDLLFLSQTANNRFITFDGNLELIQGAFPFGLQNSLAARYSIDSLGDRFALTTQNGIFTGSVSDNVATQIDFSTALNGFSVRDTGNLDSASPIILNQQTAFLLSDVGVNEADGSFIGNTENFAFFAGLGEQDFEVVSGFTGVNTTSLNFAGPGGLLASTSGVLSPPNGANTSNLFLVDLSQGADGLPLQVGPNGNPQLVNGMFSGGDLSFAGFSFNDNTGGNFIGSGANYDARAFSANSVNEAFVLGNALLGIDGNPGNDVSGELLIFDEQVIAVGSNFNIGTQTSVGEVAFADFDNVILAENGDLLFTARTSQVNGQPLANPVGLRRVVDPGGPNQAIVAVLTVGDDLVVSQSGLDDLFGNGGQTAALVAGFDTGNIALSQGLTRDGRPQLLSVNEQGHVATVVQIESTSGPVNAIVAQDDNGVFHVVAFIGQVIDVDGQGDLRRITNFTAQFGSNDIDGAGDLFNGDEQLGFIVTLDDEATSAQEFTRAVFRVSLNGVEIAEISEFLWQGGCGDDKFFTRCIVNGENASNWVDAQDTSEISEDPPGFDPGQHTAIVRGADLRISVEDVNLARLESDSTITLEDGRTLTLANGGDINRLVSDRGSLVNSGTLTIGTLDFGVGTITANDRIFVEDDLVLHGTRIEGALGIDVQADGAVQSSGPQALLGGNLELATNLRFFDSSQIEIDTASLDLESNGRIEVNDGSELAIIGSSIVGEGQILVESANSSITSQGLNFLLPTLTFLEADSEREARSAPDLLRVLSSTLSANHIVFDAQGLSSISVGRGAGIGIDAGAVLEIMAGGTLDVQSFVEVRQSSESQTQGVSTLNLLTGSNLEIGTFGTLQLNLGDGVITNLNQVSATGGGLLLDQSTLNVTDSSFEVVLASLAAATFAGDNMFVTDEAAAQLRRDDDLLGRGIMLASGAEFDGSASPIAISALLNGSTFAGGDNVLEGDGVAFLIDTQLQGGRLDSTANLLLAGGLTLNNQAIFTGLGSQTDPATIAVLATNPEPAVEGSAILSGDGIAQLDNTLIEGLPIMGNDQFQSATLLNQLGTEFLEANPDLLITLDPLIPTNTGSLQIGQSDLSSIVVVNEGILRLGENDFLADAIVINEGFLTIAGGLGDMSEVSGERTSAIVNRVGGRINFSDAQNIAVDLDNLGVITLSGPSVDVTVNDLVVSDGEGMFGSIGIADQAMLTVNTSDAIFVSEDLAGDSGSLSANWFVDNGTIRLLDSEANETFINEIAQSARVEIFGAGRINNLDANGRGLRTVNGIFFGDGGFQGGDFDIGEDGLVGFAQDSEFGALNLAQGSQLDVDGLIAFTNATVEGQVFADRLTGTSLTILDGSVFDQARPFVDVTSVPLGSTNPTVLVDRISIGEAAGLIYRGAIIADDIIANGLITSDDFEASTLVERITTNTLSIGSMSLVSAEELIVRDTLTIAASGQFVQSGDAELEVNNLELDGTLMGESITISGDLRIGTDGFLDIIDTVNALGRVRVNGILAADTLRAGEIEISSIAALQVTRFLDIGEDVRVDGSLNLGPQVDIDDDLADSIIGQFGGDLNVASTGQLTGQGDVSVDGSLSVEDDGIIDIEGVLLAGLGIDLEGDVQAEGLGSNGDINVDGNGLIAGDDITNQAFAALTSGLAEPQRSRIEIPGFDDEDIDVAAGGNLTVGPSANLGVDGGTLVSADFSVGPGATYSSSGPFLGFGDYSAGLGSTTSIQNSAFIDGSVTVSGFSEFLRAISSEDIRVTNGGEARFTSDPSSDGDIDFSVSLDRVNQAVQSLIDTDEDGAFSATFENGAFDFNPRGLGFGAFGDVDVEDDATLVSGGNSFVGGALTNEGDAFFNGDLLTGFEVDDPDITFTNGDEDSDDPAEARFDLIGNLGTVGGLRNFGDLNVEEGIFVGGDSRNDGNLRFGADYFHAENGQLENNGTLVGGQPAEAGFELEPYRIVASRVVNRGFIGGTGTIEGDFLQEVQQDAATLPTISPGFSPGIINITGDALFNDGVVLFEIGGLTPGTEHDQINVGGNLTIGSNAMIVVDLLELDDGSGIFLPRTGDEIVLFTASDITPDDVEQINFSVIDVLPLGFTLVADISRTETGEIFRVLRGFDGSQLSLLDGLNPSQAAVAGAIDFLSTAESGVPSPELFEVAVGLQFADDRQAQLDGLTALSASTLSALQDSAMQAGSIGLNFAEGRLRSQAGSLVFPAQSASLRQGSTSTALAGLSQPSGRLNKEGLAAMVAQRASQGGGTEFLAGNGSVLRIVGSTSYLFGDSSSRGGTVGFDYDGWSASSAIEFEGVDGALLVGAALSLGSVEADLESDLGGVETESFAATVYAQYTGGSVSLALGYSTADLDLENQRQVLGTSAIGEADGKVQHFFSRIGVQFVDTDDWKIGPEIGFTHSDLEIDSLSEESAGAFSLISGALDRQSTRMNLAGVLAREFETDDFAGALSLSAGYQFALSGDGFTTVPVAFSVDPSTVFENPLRPLQNSGVDLAVGLSLKTVSGINIGVRYDGLWAENGQSSHDVSASLSVQF